MAFLVSLVGIGVAGIGLLGVVAPGQLANLIDRWRVLTGLPVTLALRLGFGVLFVLAAPSCRNPHVVRVIGVLEFIGAAALLALGAPRLQWFVEWWLDHPPWFVRYWCAGALTLGILIAYAGGWHGSSGLE